MPLSINVADKVSIAVRPTLEVGYQQMYCNAKTSQVIDPQDTANNIPAQVIEYQNFPYGIAIRIQDRRRLRDEFVVS